MGSLLLLGPPGFLLALTLSLLFAGSRGRAAALAGLSLLVVTAFVLVALRSDPSTCHDSLELAGAGYPPSIPVILFMNGLGAFLGAVAGSALRVRSQRQGDFGLRG